jgi:hypothetical protein
MRRPLWCRRRAQLNAMNEKKPLDMSGFFNGASF